MYCIDERKNKQPNNSPEFVKIVNMGWRVVPSLEIGPWILPWKVGWVIGWRVHF